MVVANATTDIYMLCHSHSDTVFNIPEIQHAIGDIKKHLMFLHAVTGCDTISAIYCKSKRKAFNMVQKKQDYDLLDTFTHEKVKRAGEAFILNLYGASSFTSLNDYRHTAYKQIIGRSSNNSTFLLKSPPPTNAASKQYLYRAYLTVQE